MKKSESTWVNPLISQSLAQDRDNPIERNDKKKAWWSISNTTNVEWWNWKSIFFKKKRTNKRNSQPRLTIETGDSGHELETKLIEEKL